MGEVYQFGPKGDVLWIDNAPHFERYVRGLGALNEDVPAIMASLRAHWDHLQIKGFDFSIDSSRFDPPLLPGQMDAVIKVAKEVGKKFANELSPRQIETLLAFADLEVALRRDR